MDEDQTQVSVAGHRQRGAALELSVVLKNAAGKRRKVWLPASEVESDLREAYLKQNRLQETILHKASSDHRPSSLPAIPAHLSSGRLQEPVQASIGHGTRLRMFADELLNSIEQESHEESRQSCESIRLLSDCISVRSSKRASDSTMTFATQDEMIGKHLPNTGMQCILSRVDLKAEADVLGTIESAKFVRHRMQFVICIIGSVPATPKASPWIIQLSDGRGWPTYNVQRAAVQELLSESKCMSANLRELLVAENRLAGGFAAVAPEVRGFRLPTPIQMEEELQRMGFAINKSQMVAAQAVVRRTMTLIQGPPGTGKSSTGASIVAALVQFNKRTGGRNMPILVTCDSNFATDTFLALLSKRGVTRLARMARSDNKSISELAKKYVPPFQDNTEMTYSERQQHLERHICSAEVVLCTNTSAARLRDLCNFAVHFIDEAAQSSMASGLVGLVRGNGMVVLLGDHKQLSPFSHFDSSLLEDQSRSIFERFLDLGVESVMLKTQYRMHPDICKFPSTMFYNGLLESAPEVARLPKIEGFPWPDGCRVVCVNVSGKEESSTGRSYSNEAEAKRCQRIIQKLKMPEGSSSIVVLTFYQDQKSLLKELIHPKKPKVKIFTVDAFQGQEADLVLLSMVRSGTGRIGFLNDARRINVALTRARLGLIVVGDTSMMQRDPLLGAWLETVAVMEFQK